MISFDFERFCCGCTVCANSCPVDAITMQENREGFLMPIVDTDKCIGCGVCEKKCPYLNTEVDISTYSLADFDGKPAYLYYSNNNERIDSASGGFVHDVFLKTIENGGYACGCVWDKDMRACHILGRTHEDLRKMQSSKYVQSDLSTCFKQIREKLSAGEKVAFCGTPCQTAGLKHYLGKLADGNGLISICLICHGVASPKVWEHYKTGLEKKYKGHMVAANMRDKHAKGYSLSHARYTFAIKNGISGRSSEMSACWPTYLSDPYIFLFTDNLFLRNSCHHCKYKSVSTGADVIVGDFYASTRGAGNDGCSCLVALTEKGSKFTENLEGTRILSSIQEVGGVNPMIYRSANMHPKRKDFFEDLNNKASRDISLFRKYLPLRFYVKNALGKIGLFNFVKRLIG